MKAVLVIVALLVVGLGVFAYKDGWFEVKKDEHGKVTVVYNKEAFKVDKEKAKKYLAEEKKKTAELLEQAKEKLAKLAADVKGDEKAKHEREIAELKRKMDELENSHKELSEEDESKLEALHKKYADLIEKIKKEEQLKK